MRARATRYRRTTGWCREASHYENAVGEAVGEAVEDAVGGVAYLRLEFHSKGLALSRELARQASHEAEGEVVQIHHVQPKLQEGRSEGRIHRWPHNECRDSSRGAAQGMKSPRHRRKTS